MQVSIGISKDKNPVRAAEEACKAAQRTLSGQANLAIVFATIKLASLQMLSSLSGQLPGVPLVGCSAFALITPQGIFKHGLAVMLVHLHEKESCQASCVSDIAQKGGLASGEALAEQLIRHNPDPRRSISMILSDGLSHEGSDLVAGMQEILGSSFPLVGASASDNLIFEKTYVFYNNALLSDAACALLWGGKVRFGLGSKHGWRPLGKPRTVTKSNGNVIFEIDGSPACLLYEEYLNQKRQELQQSLKRISSLYPIGLFVPGEEEYLLRNMVSLEPNGAIVLQGNAPERSQIRLMIGTKESCLQATRIAVDDALGMNAHARPACALVFDSASRYILLANKAEEELTIIRHGLGDKVPFLGVYTYGEQAPLNSANYLGKPHFHNQTFTMLTLGA